METIIQQNLPFVYTFFKKYDKIIWNGRKKEERE